MSPDSEDRLPGADKRSAADDNPFIQVRHDLRNAVDHILGYSEILRDECRDRQLADFDSDLERIQTAARRILSLVDGLLSDAISSRKDPTGSEPLPAAPAGAVGSDHHDSAAGESGRILVVDDDQSGRELLARRLERLGYEVTTAEDGESALRGLEDDPFELVLLDLDMPGLGGMGTLESLRQRLSPTELPVIVVTGQADSADIVRALDHGANDYVVKPFDSTVLEARIRSQLSLSRLSHETALLSQQLELRSRFLRQVFGRYLSDEVVQTLLSSPLGLKLGGERRTITVLMADLRGFSAHAERLDPEQVMTLLNLYLSAMTDVIIEAGGTIDEFLGDAVLVFFGAPLSRPDHARAAVHCALQMQNRMGQVRDRLAELGLPRVEMGVGIHTGEAVIGNIGSEKRAKFGAVGRTINLTARIEGLTAGGEVLISSDTREAVDDAIRINSTFDFHPKGEPSPIAVHQIHGIGGDSAIELPGLVGELTPPRRPLRLALTPFDGKRLGQDSMTAEVVRLSKRAAEIRITGELEVRSDVQLEFPTESAAETAPIVYAKVVAAPEGEAETWRLQFTWLPAETAARITTALGRHGDESSQEPTRQEGI